MGNNLGEKIKYWGQLFLVPLYGLSFLMPRDKKIWLFGSTFGRRFAESPRCLYLYVSQHSDASEYFKNHSIDQEDISINGIRPVWISHNKKIADFLNENGYEAYYYHSLKGIWLALRAGVYIYDNYSKDINFWQSGGAFKFNLWHGTGNKKINHDNIHDTVRHPRNKWEKWKTWLRRLSDEKPTDYILTTSDAMKPHFASAFAVKSDHVVVDGYPRNDLLFPYEECRIHNLMTDIEEELCEKINSLKEEGYRIITYMPTFRDSEKKFFDVMDMEKFNDYLKSKRLILVNKVHVKSKLKKEFEKAQYSNIINADPDTDTYTFLGLTDMLITDYSSVYTDYMLLDRPVVAFIYDWDDYSKDSRECTIRQDVYMPELQASTMDELIVNIDLLRTQDPMKDARHESRERMFNYLDGKSSKRLTEWIIKMTSNRPTKEC